MKDDLPLLTRIYYATFTLLLASIALVVITVAVVGLSIKKDVQIIRNALEEMKI